MQRLVYNTPARLILMLLLCALSAPACRQSGPSSPPRPLEVRNGVDVLEDEGFTLLAGKRVGLITNHSGLTADGRRTLDVFWQAPQVNLVAVFAPEHGIEGTLSGRVGDSEDGSTGLKVFSLYGKTRRPTAEMLDGLDVLVFDLQDVGVRYYTYGTTMAYAMEAAEKHGVEFMVLDRVNPIGGDLVEGPMLDANRINFEGYFPLPLRHGMTLGELARLYNEEASEEANEEKGIRAELTVVPIRGWRRTHWYWQTQLWESQSDRTWVLPSPNIRSGQGNAFYPAVELLRAGDVSVGRGTATPFELFGAPWIDGERLADYLNQREIPGVRFSPAEFVPDSDVHAGDKCSGVRLELISQDTLRAGLLGVELLSALHTLYTEDFQLDKTIRLVGSVEMLDRIHGGDDPNEIVAGWQEELAAFNKLREKYLLYD